MRLRRHIRSALVATTLLVGMLWQSPAEAQAFARNRSRIAATLYGGFTLPHNTFNGTGKLSNFPGLAFGFGGEYRISPTLSLGLDVLFVSKGHVLDANGVKTKYTLNFVEFPVQVKWTPVPYFSLRAGPYLAGLMVSAFKDVNGEAAAVKNEFNNDFGLTAGMWLGFWNTPGLALGLDIRYDWGLADVQNDSRPVDNIHTRAVIGMATLVIGF